MKVLMVYSSKYGCTEDCVKLLASKLNEEVDLINLSNNDTIDLSKYDKVIIGGSIYIGSIQKNVKEFCQSNLEALKGKKLGLFVCCMRDGEMAEIQIKSAFPQELLDIAVAKDYFGGKFDFKKMGFLDKLITKKVAKIKDDTSNILTERIEGFAAIMNKE